MRATFVIVTLFITLAAVGQQTTVAAPDPDPLLARGIEHYQAGRYAEAVADLNATTQALLSGPEMQAYVDSGKFSKLPQFETALVYLALSHSRLGNEAAAREAVQRLLTAERIEPTFSDLQIAEGGEFSSLAARLVPGSNLAGGSVQVATTTPTPQPQRVQLVEQMVNEECARIQREAEEQIAAIRQDAEERIAAAERAAAERIAAAERDAEQRIAEAEARRREAEARVAEVPVPRPAPVPVPQPQIPVETRAPGDWRELLDRADQLVAAGRLAEANEIYARVGSSAASRDLRMRAAVGLYRTGAYWQAVNALQRIAPFARGEEDLRYYHAVSLYETGRYAEARAELICALPFIRQTEDVIRYRTKIEQMVAWQDAEPVRSVSQ